MLPVIESFLHRLRRRFSRSEWAIRNLELSTSDGTAEEPGLLLIQIDGLARTQLERAIDRGFMPFLRKLRRRENYDLHTFYPGLPSTTPAVQAELYYGVRAAVPAFTFFDRARKKFGAMWYPEWAKEYEADFQTRAKGLLSGGSSWSNIYTGGADFKDSHFCAASIGWGDMWRGGKIRQILVFTLAQFPTFLRIMFLLVVEVFAASWDVLLGVLRGEKLVPELAMALSRIFVGVGVREVITIGGKIDVARGLPIIHLNFLGYDEHAHRRGPGSLFALWTLRTIDREIKQLYRAAMRSHRRDYSVWVFSDHGQERVYSFSLEKPGRIGEMISKTLQEWGIGEGSWHARSERRSYDWSSQTKRAQKRREEREKASMLGDEERKNFVMTGLGPVGHVYFTQEVGEERRREVARRLVKGVGVPGVLVRGENCSTILWIHAKGETAVPAEVPGILPHDQPIAQEIARDLVDFCGNVHCGDLILLGWSPGSKPWTFAPERGAHAGCGPEETRGFCLLPARTRLPEGTEHFIRPSALRDAALHLLGRSAFEETAAVCASDSAGLRFVTYNVHGCSGMDGRVSPRRIARVLRALSPDVVALQELDLGRRRSRAEDQASIIARELGMHVVFCPTVTIGEEHYGHALLSRWPVEIVRRAFLPTDGKSWWQEPRAALWARINLCGEPTNIITTHLGLGPNERLLQMKALLSEEWIGGISAGEGVILCGDFNLSPGSAPYLLAAAKLRDAQAGRRGGRPLSTFTSARPVMRIDHLFVSRHFEPRGVIVPRNSLTRLASDHLPLVVDLLRVPSVVEKPMHTTAR